MPPSEAPAFLDTIVTRRLVTNDAYLLERFSLKNYYLHEYLSQVKVRIYDF